MSDLSVQTLGRIRFLLDDESEVRLRTRKHAALALYLLSRPSRDHSRGGLAELLWGHRGSRARASLTQALYEIRCMLGLAISSGTDAIRMQSGRTRLDARRFEEAALAGDHESALAYYHGRFAPGLARCATRDFEEWCERERTRYHCLAHISFGALCDRYSRDDPPEALLHFAHSWVRRFPTDDVAQQRFAEALDRAGERRGAAAVEALLRSS